tara:strand:- start:540 stop:1052 length:513 start_codon:yes stop_codon:yes gene_type:complete
MNFLINLKEKKKLFFKRQNIIYLLVIFIIFLFDRLTKLNIVNNYNETSYFFNDYINLNLVWNTGVGFGLLSSTSNFIYNIITGFIGFIILILLYFTITSNSTEKIIFSIIIGGASGNFYDRIFFSAVPDFIDLHYKNFHWFTFNVADIFITLGLIALIIYSSPKRKDEKN